jgi:cyclohexanone monooxygenase
MVALIDQDALRRKYAEERDKRLRPDGNGQYLRLTGEFAHYQDDPHTPWTERAAITDHRTVVCVGGGFAGLVAAARLSVPKLPGIPGIGSFGGHSFHTSRWGPEPGGHARRLRGVRFREDGRDPRAPTRSCGIRTPPAG